MKIPARKSRKLPCADLDCLRCRKGTGFRYDVKKKELISEAYRSLGTYAAAAREFGINEPTVRKILKQSKVERNKKEKS